MFLSTLLFSCQKDRPVEADYSKYVTITQGLWGSVVFREGDWQPQIDESAIEYPVKRTIYIYQLTTTSQAIQDNGQGSSFFSQINSQLVGQTKSNKNGFYQIELPPGQYSVFVEEKGEYYCTSWDGYGNMCPVTINSNATTEKHLLIDYKAVY